MKNPYAQFAVWGRIGGRLGQRLLTKAKNRKEAIKPANMLLPSAPKHRGRPKGSSNFETSARNQAIVKMFVKQNATLLFIGSKFGITRERVRQILVKAGVTHSEGMLYKTRTGRIISETAKKETARQERLEKSCYRYLDCSIGAYTDITGKLWTTWHSTSRLAKAYWDQKHNANIRGIAWGLTFPLWYEIWRASGKLESRGRGQNKYVMGRYGDTGGYTPENVLIISSIENNSDTINKKTNLPIGIRYSKNGINFMADKMVGGRKYRLGTFSTLEAAQTAYEKFTGK